MRYAINPLAMNFHFMQSKRYLSKFLCLVVLLLVAACASQPAISVQPLPRYDALFDSQQGWTGADGVYSVPLSDSTTLWLFGDTWLGDVHDNAHVNATIVNNSVAIQHGRLAQGAVVKFYYGHTPDGNAAAFIRPADGRGWLWIYHGVVIREHLYLFMVQIERTAESPAAGFRIIGTWLGQVANPRDPPQDWKMSQQKIPWGSFSSAATLFGSWVLKQGQWIYIYGTTEEIIDGFHHKYMILARAPQSGPAEFDQWQFFVDGKWSADYKKAQRLCAGVANEYSVSYLPAMGNYIAVYSDSGRPDNIVARFAPNPWGPWDDPVSLYRCPEARWGENIICYAAKGHPDISELPDELIISYIANSTDFETMVSDARLYRPRFIRVRVSP
jgi:hypothetical protein